MSKYDQFLKAQLNKGAALGSELANSLIEQFGIEPENARKIIQRATQKNRIISSTPLTFGKGQFLYVKPGQYFGIEMVKEASRLSRKPLYRLLEILATYKIISFYEGLKLTASPDEKGSTKISLLINIIHHLEKLGIIFTKKDIFGNNYIITKDPIPPLNGDLSHEPTMEAHLQSMKLDAIIIPDILRWLKHMNLVDLGSSYRSVLSPANGVKHNEVMWDAIAYTKTTGINPLRASEADVKEKQTLVVLDVLISRKYLQADLDGFLARVQINLNSVQMGERKVMPIVVFQEIDLLTLNRMKVLGFISFDIKTIFGNNINLVVEKFKRIFSSEPGAADEIEPALQAIEESGHVDQLRALRGVLFEVLMHPIIKSFYQNAQVFQSKRLTNPKDEKIREFDLILISSHPKEILLVELKGYTGKSYIQIGSSDAKDTLRYFFRGSVPIAQRFYKANRAFEEHPVRAAYITTGKFHSNTSVFIEKVEASTFKPSKFGVFYDGMGLEKLLVENGFDHEAKIIKKYYPQPSENE